MKNFETLLFRYFRMLIVVFFIFVNHHFVFPQQNSNLFAVSSNIEYATLLPHHKMMYPLAERKFFNFKLDFSKPQMGNKFWHQKYNFPETGITFLYSDLSSSEKIGNAYAIMPFIKVFVNPTQNFRHSFYFGCGMGYVTKTFHPLGNYKNIGIGSHFNAALRLFYHLQFPINEHLVIESGLGLTHFSNGATAHPNRGLNQMSVALGLKYQNKKPAFINRNLDTAFAKKWAPQIYFNTGYKRLFVGDETAYGAFNLGFDVLWKYNVLKAAVMGVEGFYDASDRAFYKANNVLLPMSDFIKIGIYGGHQWTMDRLSFAIHFGGYLHAPNKVGDIGDFYNRLVLRYKVNQSFSLNSSIKAHFAKADFIEWGVVFHPNFF